MKRALAPLTWWAIGIGYTMALAVIVLPVTWLGTAAYLCSALTLVAATFVAARVHRVNRHQPHRDEAHASHDPGAHPEAVPEIGKGRDYRIVVGGAPLELVRARRAGDECRRQRRRSSFETC